MCVRIFSTDERRRRLALRHRLVPERRVDDPVDVAAALVALHSSDPATVFLSAGARLETPTIDAIERSLYGDRRLLRHHAFRRTIWVMTPALAAAAHASATAKIAAAERRTLLKIIVQSDSIDAADTDAAADWCRRALASIEQILAADGPTTTRSIGQQLPELTVPIVLGAGTKNAGEVAAHTRVLQLAGFEADLVRTEPSAGWNMAEYAWSEMKEWNGSPLTGMAVPDAAAQVLEAWLEAFGPATETDIRWWTGWTVTQMRTALADIRAEEVRVETRPDEAAWILADDHDAPEPPPWIALLPGLDPTTMGWKQRDWYLADDVAARTFDRWGNAGPTIWRNGEVVGGWAQRPDGSVATELFTPLDRREQAELDDQIDRFRSLVGDTRIRVRFPAPNQKELLAP